MNNGREKCPSVSTKDKGNTAEDIATGFLARKGYLIRERNYRSSFGEIDIIAEKNELLVFVEVKYRKSNFLEAFSSISISKKKKLIRTALYYLQKHPHDSQKISRFDVIAIVDSYSKNEYEIKHVEDAFRSDSVSYDLWDDITV